MHTIQKYNNAIVGPLLCQLKEKNTIWALGSKLKFRGLPRFALCYKGYTLDEVAKLNLTNPLEVQMICGNGALIPSNCYSEIGLYDQKHFPQYHADSDFCLRARKNGYTIYVDRDVILFNDTENIGTEKISNLFHVLFSKNSSRRLSAHLYAMKYFTYSLIKTSSYNKRRLS
jgi:GT2 family glycosyltransferase